ncbi:MarR family winged helix-turn-helix transcriptional regulator [Streptomyces sp. I05A-00742]|uniref:MarR family winged helix-turn-helix transcriptional regulator n=1 Tax=Streptomyces sp. I05A-00742 TaxID=2732853 RepID=UPI001488B04E|nr:MarR family transcriptional regulator [Streptomyces sp. I05A-00742]
MNSAADTVTTGASIRDIRLLVVELGKRMDAHRRARIAEFDLTLTQAKALEELGDPKTARELAVVLSCEPPNVTYIMDKLEKRGLVVREPHPQDRRAKRLVLTEAGREMRLKLLRRMGQDSPLDHLAQDDLNELRDRLFRALDGPEDS